MPLGEKGLPSRLRSEANGPRLLARPSITGARDEVLELRVPSQPRKLSLERSGRPLPSERPRDVQVEHRLLAIALSRVAARQVVLHVRIVRFDALRDPQAHDRAVVLRLLEETAGHVVRRVHEDVVEPPAGRTRFLDVLGLSRLQQLSELQLGIERAGQGHRLLASYLGERGRRRLEIRLVPVVPRSPARALLALPGITLKLGGRALRGGHVAQPAKVTRERLVEPERL